MSERILIDSNIGHSVEGYFLFSPLKAENQRLLATLQKKLMAEFPNMIWCAPPKMLHITLMDWIAPLVNYGEPKKELFRKFFPLWDQALTTLLKSTQPFEISFGTLRVYPSAIIVEGQDMGQMKHIRDQFIQGSPLVGDTKKPPTIIHTTLARFIQEGDLQPVKDFISQQSVTFSQPITEFHLARIVKTYHIFESDILKKYFLG